MRDRRCGDNAECGNAGLCFREGPGAGAPVCRVFRAGTGIGRQPALGMRWRAICVAQLLEDGSESET